MNYSFISRHRKWIILFIIVIGVCVVGVFSNHSALQRVLAKANLLPTQEYFTELYFEDHATLPKEFVVGQKNTFSFTIVNKEATTTDYKYEVYLVDTLGRVVMIDTNTVPIAVGESKTVAQSFVIKHPQQQERVFVELPELQQSIHFQMLRK